MNDLKFTTAGEYINDIDEHNRKNGRETVERIGVTGGETRANKVKTNASSTLLFASRIIVYASRSS